MRLFRCINNNININYNKKSLDISWKPAGCEPLLCSTGGFHQRRTRYHTRRSSVEVTCLSALHWANASAALFPQVWVREGGFSCPGINMMRVITAILALCLSLCAGSFQFSFNIIHSRLSIFSLTLIVRQANIEMSQANLTYIELVPFYHNRLLLTFII